MRAKLVKIQEYILALIILTMSFTQISKNFALPLLGRSVPNAFLLIGVLIFIIYSLKYRAVQLPHKKYLVLFLGWYTVCILIGALNYPFYDTAFFDYIRTEGYYGRLVRLSPAVFDNNLLMELKYAFSNVLGTFKGFFLPLFGIWLIIINLFHKDWKRGIHKISLAALILAIIMMIYSIPEVIWLWTGNKTCAAILSTINSYFYDPATTNGWWPPLLWKNQLRSITMEPSFFGIIASFIIPLLWYRIFVEGKKWCYGILVIFVSMLFASKARTGIAVYLGEMSVLLVLSLILKNKAYLKFGAKVLLAGVLSYVLFMGGSTYVPAAVNGSHSNPIDEAANLYIEENVKSVVGNKRSNVARNGNTVALIKVGLDYPVFGVGFGYKDMYMMDRFPKFAEGNHEIQNWTKDMLEKGFLNSKYPVLNQYAYVFACGGVIGLLIFITPMLYLGIKLLKNGKLLYDPAVFILTVATCGQLADLLSNTFFLTFPITLSFLYLAIQGKSRKIKEDVIESSVNG